MSLDITDAIQDLWPNCPVPLLQGIIDTADDVFAKFEMAGNRLRILHFMTQISSETNGGSPSELSENMNYSAQRLVQIFGVGHHSAAITESEAQQLAHNPELIADRVYGIGNPRKAQELGNTEAGDGWRHRGMGLLQTTGKSLQALVGQVAGVDLASNPELLLDPQYALLCAAADFVGVCKCLPWADEDNLLAVSGCVNVGHPNVTPAQVIGWSDRQQWYQTWSGRLS